MICYVLTPLLYSLVTYIKMLQYAADISLEIIATDMSAPSDWGLLGEYGPRHHQSY